MGFPNNAFFAFVPQILRCFPGTQRIQIHPSPQKNKKTKRRKTKTGRRHSYFFCDDDARPRCHLFQPNPAAAACPCPCPPPPTSFFILSHAKPLFPCFSWRNCDIKYVCIRMYGFYIKLDFWEERERDKNRLHVRKVSHCPLVVLFVFLVFIRRNAQ